VIDFAKGSGKIKYNFRLEIMDESCQVNSVDITIAVGIADI